MRNLPSFYAMSLTEIQTHGLLTASPTLYPSTMMPPVTRLTRENRLLLSGRSWSTVGMLTLTTPFSDSVWLVCRYVVHVDQFYLFTTLFEKMAGDIPGVLSLPKFQTVTLVPSCFHPS